MFGFNSSWHSQIKSPQILELSGIGKPSVLSKAGVDCIVENLRVGENFQDHPVSALGFELNEGEKTLDSLRDPNEIEVAMKDYMTNRNGPLSTCVHVLFPIHTHPRIHS